MNKRVSNYIVSCFWALKANGISTIQGSLVGHPITVKLTVSEPGAKADGEITFKFWKPFFTQDGALTG